MAATDELLAATRSYLDITWADAEGDKKLAGILERGKKYLDRIGGGPLNYVYEDKPRELLLEYARYVRSGALDEFQSNYLSELMALQISEEVKRRAPPKTANI